MARLPRIVIPGQPLHVIQRGNDRIPTFRASGDFEAYKRALGDAAARERCAIHAYVLMTNHVHLLVTPSDEHGVARMIQIVGRRYVRYFNDNHERTGTLWEGRFRSTLIDSDRYFFVCSRYIELNPVRAGMVARPENYKWSSFACNALGADDHLVVPHFLYNALGARISERRVAYRALFEHQLEEHDLDEIRAATKSGKILGPPTFRRHTEEVLGLPSSGPRGGDRRSVAFRAQISNDSDPFEKDA